MHCRCVCRQVYKSLILPPALLLLCNIILYSEYKQTLLSLELLLSNYIIRDYTCVNQTHVVYWEGHQHNVHVTDGKLDFTSCLCS